MPIVQISMIEGRDEARINACLKAIAQSVHQTLGAPLQSIRVIANMVPATHWAVGDVTKDGKEGAEAPSAQ